MGVLNWVSSSIWRDRSADASKLNALDEMFPLIAHHWGGARAETWFLDFLCVHPEFQRRGHGRDLVRLGVQRSEEEGVCTSLISSWNKEGFYGKSGFVETGRANVGGLKELKGGAIMFRDAAAG